MAAQSSGHPQQSPGVGDVERLRERILRDAEEQFARELKKMSDGDSASFTSVRSAGGEQRRDQQGGDQSKAGGGPPETPPGLGQPPDHGRALQPTLMKTAESVTASLPEAMRNLELPPLPSPSAENAAFIQSSNQRSIVDTD